MKFYFEAKVNYEPREEGKLAKIELWPDSNGAKIKPIRILVAKEIETVVSGENYNFGLVGERKTPMIFPPSKPDNRILLLAEAPSPGHRKDGMLDTAKTTGQVLKDESGYGAWGSGECFLILLEPGQKAVTSELRVWENINGELKEKTYETLAEYQIDYEETTIEIL